MTTSPALIVLAPSGAGLALAGHLTEAATRAPHPGFADWCQRHGRQPLADAALRELAQGSWPRVLAAHDETAAATLDALAAAWPQARFLVLAEAPEHTLASALPLPDGQTVAAWSAARQATARHLLRHVQAHRARCVCVVVHELAAQPHALAEALPAGLDLRLSAWADVAAGTAPPALAQALAGMLLAADGALAATAAELLACCLPLGDDIPVAGPAVDHAAMLRELAALNAHAAQAPVLRERIASLEPALSQARQSLDAARAEQRASADRLARLEAELDGARRAGAAADAAHREGELLLAQLHQVQEELELVFLQKRELAARIEAQAAASRTDAQHAERQRAEHARVHAGHARVQAEYAGAKAEHARTQAALDAARQEGELLLVQLHQVQEELEHYFLKNRELEARAESGAARLRLDTCTVEAVRDTQPHVELTLVLAGVRVGDGDPIGSLRVRLVEHHGRPGLVLFRPHGDDRPVFSCWHETGREAEQPYMLLVPGDTAGLAVLQRLATTDWDTLQALVARLHAELTRHAALAESAWPGVAARLARQLAELPPRLRYDALDIEPATPAGFAVSLRNVLYGVRRFERLRLLWRPESDDPLSLVAPADPSAPPALEHWPRQQDGAWQDVLPLPLGRRMKRASRPPAIGAADRDFVLALLDAMPAAAVAARERGLVPAAQEQSLHGAAVSLLRNALAAIQPGRGRLRHLLRRVAA